MARLVPAADIDPAPRWLRNGLRSAAGAGLTARAQDPPLSAVGKLLTRCTSELPALPARCRADERDVPGESCRSVMSSLSASVTMSLLLTYLPLARSAGCRIMPEGWSLLMMDVAGS